MNVDKFVAERTKLREELGRHETALMAQLRSLDDILWERPFNAAEKKKRKALVDALTEVHREQFFLIEADIREFDKKPRILALKAHFEKLAAGMKKRQEKLEKLVGAVQTATKVIKAAEKVAQQLAALAV